MFHKKNWLNLYGLTGLILLVFALITTGITEIAVHDSYFIFADSQIFLILTILFSIYYGISFGMRKIKKPLNSSWIFIHWIITISGIIAILLLLKQPNETVVATYSDFSIYNPEPVVSESISRNSQIFWVFLFTLSAQLIFIGNLFFSVVRKSRP